METSVFDERYLSGIRDRDPEVESHFVAYFRMPIWLKARRQLHSLDLAEDAAQETVLRVLRYFRSGKNLDYPERLPAFVQSICHNVTLEMIRTKTRFRQAPETAPDPEDPSSNAEVQAVSEERKALVREILARLPDKDRDLLHLSTFEEMDKAELCERFGVGPEYLRVLLHRARQRFRAALEKAEAGSRVKSQGAG